VGSGVGAANGGGVMRAKWGERCSGGGNERGAGRIREYVRVV